MTVPAITSRTPSQSFGEACERFVRWLDNRVLVVGRGDETDRLDVDPSATFWLGRLASEEEVQSNPLGDRAERLDPCAIGIRIRPAGPPPWILQVNATFRAWIKEGPEAAPDPTRLWRRLERITSLSDVTVKADDDQVVAGEADMTSKLAASGAPGLSAEIRVDVEQWQSQPELVIQLVNTSRAACAPLKDNHLYETCLEVSGLQTKPFVLEALPDSFRYDRDIAAYGINVGVASVKHGVNTFRTTDVTVVETNRPTYWNSELPRPDLRFVRLATKPLDVLSELVTALRAYDEANWSAAVLDGRQVSEGWTNAVRDHATTAAADVFEELARIEGGLDLLTGNADLLRAFRLMNTAMSHSAKVRGYDAWRPFQIGFLLSALHFLANQETESGTVDTVWFATGGGKTETYLGLLVTAAIYDRLTGKSTGVTAWSRFPLRMLSLQQTQRFADALAGAELVRRTEGIKGAPFSLGFYVGSQGTPNFIDVDPKEGAPDPDDESMPARYQVLLVCPFCQRQGITMRMDRRLWRLSHECPHSDCPWPEQDLPFYIVDHEIYRFLPTVVIGTLDKAANIGMQAAMRGLVGAPLGICDQPGHGYCYAPRSKFRHGCLVPDCQGDRRSLPMAGSCLRRGSVSKTSFIYCETALVQLTAITRAFSIIFRRRWVVLGQRL